MQTVLLVIHIFLALAMIIIILLQKTSSDGLLSSGGNNSFLSGRASANLLTRTTAFLALLFMVNSLALAYLSSHTTKEGSIIEKIENQEIIDIQKKEKETDKPSIPLAE